LIVQSSRGFIVGYDAGEALGALLGVSVGVLVGALVGGVVLGGTGGAVCDLVGLMGLRVGNLVRCRDDRCCLPPSAAAAAPLPFTSLPRRRRTWRAHTSAALIVHPAF
jgi:hypothetical protein